MKFISWNVNGIRSCLNQGLEKFLSIRGTKLSEEKTKIVHISQGFDFLSRHYYKQNGIFYVIPSSKAIKSFEDNLQNFIINKGKQISQRSLIKGINAKLQGWAGYHRVEDSLNTFKHIDCIVSSLLLKLMKQIFPFKSEKQIINTYWYEEYDGKKVYSLPQLRDIRIIRLSDVILVDHRRVILNKNPYIDRIYFELRLKSQDIQKVNGDLKSILRRQRGRCFYCGRKFFKDQQKKLVHMHSLDDNSIENLSYIHESCFQDEIEFIQTDIEDPNETDVFEIIDEISHKSEINYSNLKKYFLKQKKSRFSLKFSKIEDILDEKLSPSYYLSKTHWFRKKDNISNAWKSMGFEISSVDLRKKRIFFYKSKNFSKLSIPEVFLTDKIPNIAKYELEKFFKDEDPDFFLIQEIKCNEESFKPEGYKTFYNFSKIKGYSGTAVLTKYTPLSSYFDNDGRIISLEYDRFYFINVYVPNSKDGVVKKDYRSEWEDKFREYLETLMKPIIICGDLNSDYENKNLFFLDENKFFLCNLIDEFDLIDTFRVFHPNEKVYTWKSIKNKNSGSRIDYFFISDYFSKNLEGAKIYSNIEGSDHFPIGLSLEL